MILAGLAFVGGGVFELVVQETGTEATAKITDCRELAARTHAVACTGTWSVGAGKGRTTSGLVDGATESDIGTNLPVRVAGGRAYTLSRRIPIILLVFGVAFVGYGISLLRGAGRQLDTPGR